MSSNSTSLAPFAVVPTAFSLTRSPVPPQDPPFVVRGVDSAKGFFFAGILVEQGHLSHFASPLRP